MPKPTEADRERFAALVPEAPDVVVKPMFGNLGAFVNGNMFMGLFGSDIGLRLPSDEAARLRAIDGAGPFGPVERPMGGYVTMPPSLVDDPEGGRWVAIARDHAAALPPKQPKG
jgi:TfoX/Sxy family transcriptional regulator of competence genes